MNAHTITWTADTKVIDDQEHADFTATLTDADDDFISADGFHDGQVEDTTDPAPFTAVEDRLIAAAGLTRDQVTVEQKW